MVLCLRRRGHRANRKRVQRPMRGMGLAGMAPGPNISWAHPPQHKVYPYLYILRGVPLERANLPEACLDDGAHFGKPTQTSGSTRGARGGRVGPRHLTPPPGHLGLAVSAGWSENGPKFKGVK